MEAIERYTAKFDIGDRNRRTFAGMLAAMDAGIGRVLESLRRHQLERDTLVLFLSDNGGPTPQTTATNAPYRGLKGQVLEGGIHVPFAMKWPGRIAAGSTFDSPVISLDIHSTALRAAGGAPPKEKPLDGVDLLPFVSGAAKGAPHDALYWRFGEQRAIRHGDWKLLSLGGPGAAWELYNLKTDVSERNNLASAQPELVQQLRARFETWNAQMQPPAWTRGGGARREAERP
jgi:arylsulfatase A-like enzyme